MQPMAVNVPHMSLSPMASPKAALKIFGRTHPVDPEGDMEEAMETDASPNSLHSFDDADESDDVQTSVGTVGSSTDWRTYKLSDPWEAATVPPSPCTRPSMQEPWEVKSPLARAFGEFPRLPDAKGPSYVTASGDYGTSPSHSIGAESPHAAPMKVAFAGAAFFEPQSYANDWQANADWHHQVYEDTRWYGHGNNDYTDFRQYAVPPPPPVSNSWAGRPVGGAGRIRGRKSAIDIAEKNRRIMTEPDRASQERIAFLHQQLAAKMQQRHAELVFSEMQKPTEMQPEENNGFVTPQQEHYSAKQQGFASQIQMHSMRQREQIQQQIQCQREKIVRQHHQLMEHNVQADSNAFSKEGSDTSAANGENGDDEQELTIFASRKESFLAGPDKSPISVTSPKSVTGEASPASRSHKSPKEKGAMNYCPFCRGTVKVGFKFCAFCGADLEFLGA